MTPGFNTKSAFLQESTPSREVIGKHICTSTLTMASAGKGNRLGNERSPYLLQHKSNPVDWYPWGPEAFEAAKAQNKLIFLSVGYSTCHWCHVMERESFESEEVMHSFISTQYCTWWKSPEFPLQWNVSLTLQIQTFTQCFKQTCFRIFSNTIEIVVA